MTQQHSAPEINRANRNRTGLLAIVLVLIGGILTFSVIGVPVLLFLSIPLLIAAFIVSIVGLTRKNAKKGAAVTALILSVVFGILGPIFFAGRFVADVGSAIADDSSAPTSREGAAASGIGETVKNSDGVAFTVNGVECGHSEISDDLGMTTKARGQFCVVSVRIDNDSNHMVTLSTSDITGIVGDKRFEADSIASDLGGDKTLTNINPGLGVDASFAVDVPAEAALEYVELRPTWSFQEKVLVGVR